MKKDELTQNEQVEQREILTKKEAAKKLKCSVSSIERLMRAGRLIAYRMNPPVGKVFFYADEVLKVLNQTA